MKEQNMQEIFEQIGENHLNDYHDLIKMVKKLKVRYNAKLHFQLLNAAPLMARCLLSILDELSRDELPVKDRPVTCLRIVKVLEEAGIVME